MSDPVEKTYPRNPNAPQVPFWVYRLEKEYFAAYVVHSILYGIIVILFFQCVGALIDPINNTVKRSAKWGLLAHTMALFSFTTVHAAAVQFDVLTAFIDMRNVSGNSNGFPPGPAGAVALLDGDTYVRLGDLAFPLNQWLSDGLLLYRCYVIYAMNHWVMALPCLLYTASVGMGVLRMYYVFTPDWPTKTIASYYSISLALNVILTLTIVTKLILHRKNLQHAIGAGGATGVYTAIIFMLVESYALYAIAILFYVISLALQSVGLPVTAKILDAVQIIAPYLVVLRVAKRRALTSEMISSGSDTVGLIRFKSQGTTDGDGSFPDGYPASSMQANGEAPEEFGARAENSIGEVPL